ncbi:UNKNOWN [Stylonychia lemnae]|uniref:Uncharacterized protein n=1 Tax=Stylonychia lemnae TaxID=5949 RepID=A0A077ZV03_STYLE|nr:UNKNOWN [Stylonychia lemnae]|eukprot:CDW73419.1 UNKNOWN [Stylonychia lemnae]
MNGVASANKSVNQKINNSQIELKPSLAQKTVATLQILNPSYQTAVNNSVSFSESEFAKAGVNKHSQQLGNSSKWFRQRYRSKAVPFNIIDIQDNPTASLNQSQYGQEYSINSFGGQSYYGLINYHQMKQDLQNPLPILTQQLTEDPEFNDNQKMYQRPKTTSGVQRRRKNRNSSIFQEGNDFKQQLINNYKVELDSSPQTRKYQNAPHRTQSDFNIEKKTLKRKKHQRSKTQLNLQTKKVSDLIYTNQQDLNLMRRKTITSASNQASFKRKRHTQQRQILINEMQNLNSLQTPIQNEKPKLKFPIQPQVQEIKIEKEQEESIANKAQSKQKSLFDVSKLIKDEKIIKREKSESKRQQQLIEQQIQQQQEKQQPTMSVQLSSKYQLKHQEDPKHRFQRLMNTGFDQSISLVKDRMDKLSQRLKRHNNNQNTSILSSQNKTIDEHRQKRQTISREHTHHESNREDHKSGNRSATRKSILLLDLNNKAVNNKKVSFQVGDEMISYHYESTTDNNIDIKPNNN